MIDAYRQLLGIASSRRPPTHYELLAIDPAMRDPAAIRAAADARLAQLESHSADHWAADCARIAGEVVFARDTLLDPALRQSYDQSTAADPWWKPEMQPAAAPVEGWWQDLQPAEAPTSVPAGHATAASSSRPAVTDLIEQPPRASPGAAAPAWWSEAATQAAVAVAGIATSRESVAKAPAPTPTTTPGPPAQAPILARSASGDAFPAPDLDRRRQLASETGAIMAPPSAMTFVPIPHDRAPMPMPAPVVGMPEMLFDDDQIQPVDYPPGGSSVLPWLLLSLLILGASVVGGVWYLNRQDSTSVTAESQKLEQTPAPAPTFKGETIEPKMTRKLPVAEAKHGNPLVIDRQTRDNEPKHPAKPLDLTRSQDFHVSTETVTGIALNRDGGLFITTSSERRGPDRKCDVVMTDIATGDQETLQRMVSEGLGVAFCHNGTTAVFCDGFEVIIYDPLSKKVIRTSEQARSGGGIKCLATSADAAVVLTGSTVGSVSRWSFDGGHTPVFEAGATKVTALAVTADGSAAVAGLADGSVCLVDLKAVKLVSRWKAHAGEVTALAYSSDGTRFVSAGDDAKAHIWQVGSTKPVATHVGHQGPILDCAWCPAGQRVITAAVDKQVRLWDAAQGELIWKADTPEKIHCIAIDSHARFVLAGQSNGLVQLLPLPRAAGGEK